MYVFAWDFVFGFPLHISLHTVANIHTYIYALNTFACFHIKCCAATYHTCTHINVNTCDLTWQAKTLKCPMADEKICEFVNLKVKFNFFATAWSS